MTVKTITTLLTAALLLGAAGAGADEAATPDSRERLAEILAKLQAQSSEDGKPEYEVALPVAAAGARGSAVKVGNRFAVVWPTLEISPLTALVRNLDHQARTQALPALKPQVTQFVAAYPEYAGDSLLRELTVLLSSSNAPAGD